MRFLSRSRSGALVLGIAAAAAVAIPASASASTGASPVVGHVYVNDNTKGTNTIGAFDRHADGTLTPLAGSAFLDNFLRRWPEGGVHHVTFLVDDVQAAFERFTARGYEPFGADQEWFQMFVHPRRAGGVLLQLMRRAHGREGGDGGEGDEGRGPATPMTVEDVLAGRGFRGTGVSSP